MFPKYGIKVFLGHNLAWTLCTMKVHKVEKAHCSTLLYMESGRQIHHHDPMQNKAGKLGVLMCWHTRFAGTPAVLDLTCLNRTDVLKALLHALNGKMSCYVKHKQISLIHSLGRFFLKCQSYDTVNFNNCRIYSKAVVLLGLFKKLLT